MTWTQIRDSAAQWWDKTTQAMQLFVVGGGALVLSILVFAIQGPGRLVAGLMVAGALFVAVAFLMDCYVVALGLWEKPLGKLAGALLATMIASSSMALSSVTFNAATGLDPASFAYAVAFIAPLTAGYLITVGIMGVVVVFFAWSILYTIVGFFLAHFGGRKHSHRFDADKVVIRMVGVFALVLTNAVVIDFGGKTYESALASIARGFTFFLEMYPNDRCALSGERIHRLSDELVAVGRWEDNRLVFEQRRCEVVQSAPEP